MTSRLHGAVVVDVSSMETATMDAATLAAVAMTDEPRFSSAALCIELELDQEKFHPEFTHQICEDGAEYIRGYQPKALSTTAAATATLPCWHKSHKHHEAATHEIAIKVILAPSCRTCRLEIEATKKQKQRGPSMAAVREKSSSVLVDTATAKRRRINNDTNDVAQAQARANVFTPEFEDEEDEQEQHQQQEQDDDDDIDVSSGEEDDVVDLQVEGSTQKNRRTPLLEVKKQLSRALPDIVEVNNDNDTSVVTEDYLTTPFGTVLEEYTTRRRGSNNNDNSHDKKQQQQPYEFCLTMAHGQDTHVCQYHNSVQRLARFFIETADDVNVSSSEDGGYWRILYLFRRHDSKSKYSFAGYVTLFHFMAPFRKPLPGTIVRICQAIVLPPYQRAGHGRKMLSVIHRWAHGKYARSTLSSADGAAADLLDPSDIVEINVEDPAPAFVALRNRVDFEECLLAKERGEPWITIMDDKKHGGNGKEESDDEALFQPLTETRAKSAATRAKITPRQIHIVYEIDRLYYLLQLTSKDGVVQQSKDHLDQKSRQQDSEGIENLEKHFRLMVKRRLNSEHKEELSACKGKAEMQALLAKLYDDQRSMYEAILASVLK